MSYAWYVYTPLGRPAAVVAVEAVYERVYVACAEAGEAGDDVLAQERLGEMPVIEVCAWSPPPIAEVLEYCQVPSDLAPRYGRCVSAIRIDRPSDAPFVVAGIRLLLERMPDAVLNRNGGSLEGASEVLAELSSHPDIAAALAAGRSATSNLVRRAEATLAAFADLADLADLSTPDVAAAAELLAFLKSGVGRPRKAARVRAAVDRLPPLAERYLKRLVQYGPLADSDAARVLEVQLEQICTIRQALRDAFCCLE